MYHLTAVDAFKKDIISEAILRRLLNQDVFHSIKSKGKLKDDPSLFIFTQGKAVDFFVLILEGRVEVTIGKEGLLFESGPFTYFGTQALVQNVVTGKQEIQIWKSYGIYILNIICRFSFANGINAVVEYGLENSANFRS